MPCVSRAPPPSVRRSSRLEEFNRRRRMAELMKYSGTFSDRFPTNDEIEAVDAKRDRNLNARPRR